MFVPESKFDLLEQVKRKKNRQFWKKLKIFLQSTYNGEHIRIQKKNLKIRFFDVADL